MTSLPPTYVEGFHDRKAVEGMEYRTLGKTGLKISKLSLGGAPFSNLFGTCNEDECIELVRQAIKQGINYIDTAPWYGQGRSEALLGKALKGIPRQAYYIATKVGRYEIDPKFMFNFTAKKTEQSFDKSLELLGLDYVDVIQIHDIDFSPTLDIILEQTLPELSKKVNQGKAKYIGVTGYKLSVLKECIERSSVNISVILSYARCTMIDDTLMQYALFFKERNIGIINGALTSMGILTNRGPPDWHPASSETRKECKAAADYCKAHNVELGRLAVWTAIQYKNISGNLIGMMNMNELKANLDVAQNGISEQENIVLKHIQKKHLSKLKGHQWNEEEWIRQSWKSLKK